MLPALTFSLVAALLVWWAGRRDPACDPRLTTAALGLLALFPLSGWLPKWGLLPAATPQPVVDGMATHAWPWLAGVWLAGAAVMLARLLFASRTIGRWRKESVLLERRGRVELRLSSRLHGPVAAGVLRPVVFLPPAWTAWDSATRRAVMLHELAHHARHDPLRRWIAALACALHWCNPLVWWMARRLHEQCEFACDARVLDAGIRAERYAHLLCDLAEATAPPPPALAMAERSSLETRVRRLCGNTRPGWSRTLVVLLIAATLVTGLGLALLKPAAPSQPSVPRSEVELRLTADPFPG